MNDPSDVLIVNLENLKAAAEKCSYNVKGIYRCMRGWLHAVCTFVFVCVCVSETTR